MLFYISVVLHCDISRGSTFMLFYIYGVLVASIWGTARRVLRVLRVVVQIYNVLHFRSLALGLISVGNDIAGVLLTSEVQACECLPFKLLATGISKLNATWQICECAVLRRNKSEVRSMLANAPMRRCDAARV